MQADLHPTRYYRLPWTLNDNILGWLEPTKQCNLYCEGCYSNNETQSHKSIDQVRSDMDIFTSKRKVDSISIAGGDPLTHPRIVDIVRMIHDDYKLKPVLNTNGLALTPELLKDLKRAGVHGFTFHVDSSQTRPYWKNKNELELNALRLQFAEMVARQGGLSAAFNSTVFPHTKHFVPDLMQWGADHIDIVHSMVFILFRTMRSREFDYFASGKKVETQELVYYDQDKNPEPLRAQDVIAEIRKKHPDYDPAAYLGGTKDPDSFKWLIAGRLGSAARNGTPGRVHGYVGKKYMELVQTGHHALTGKYLGYAHPVLLNKGRTMMSVFSPLDEGVRRSARNWAKSVAKSPSTAKDKVHFQTVLIIQPVDMQPDGEMNMCDGCPDMTVHNGELVWSCRLDERLTHGVFLTCAPKATADGK